MKLRKLAASALAVATAVFGVSVITASPAAAAAGSWRAYGETNPIKSSSSTWRCAATRSLGSDIYAQACAVRAGGAGYAVQAAVIVRNSRAIGTYNAEAAITLVDAEFHTGLGRWECPRSGVGADSWSVCFGQTIQYPEPVSVGQAGVNGVYLPVAGAKV